MRHNRAPAHLALLTEVELILIADPDWSHTVRRRDRYGSVHTYVPLDRIEAVRVERGRTGLLTVGLRVAGGHPINVVFDARIRHDVDRLVAHLARAVPRPRP